MAGTARYRLPSILPMAFGGGAALIAFAWLTLDDATTLTGAIASAGGGRIGRDVAIVGGSIVAGALSWALTYLICGPGGWLDPARRQTALRPLSYADLGPPPPREQPLPTDLDQPLSAYDPDALRPGVRRRG